MLPILVGIRYEILKKPRGESYGTISEGSEVPGDASAEFIFNHVFEVLYDRLVADANFQFRENELTVRDVTTWQDFKALQSDHVFYWDKYYKISGKATKPEWKAPRASVQIALVISGREWQRRTEMLAASEPDADSNENSVSATASAVQTRVTRFTASVSNASDQTEASTIRSLAQSTDRILIRHLRYGISCSNQLTLAEFVCLDVPTCKQILFFRIYPKAMDALFTQDEAAMQFVCDPAVAEPGTLSVVLSAALGSGSFKDAYEGFLTLVRPSTSPTGLGSTVNQRVAAKRMIDTKASRRDTVGIRRFSPAVELEQSICKGNLLLWATSLFDLTDTFVRHQLSKLGEPPSNLVIPDIRFVEGGVAQVHNTVTGTNVVRASSLRRSVIIEELIPSCFVKFVHNRAAVPHLDPDHPSYHIALYLCFTQHVQYVYSGRSMFLSDYQGSESLLTDPQIMTTPEIAKQRGTPMFGGGNISELFNVFCNQHVPLRVSILHGVLQYGNSLGGKIPETTKKMFFWWADKHGAHLALEDLPIGKQSDGTACGILALDAVTRAVYPNDPSYSQSNVLLLRINLFNRISNRVVNRVRHFINASFCPTDIFEDVDLFESSSPCPHRPPPSLKKLVRDAKFSIQSLSRSAMDPVNEGMASETTSLPFDNIFSLKRGNNHKDAPTPNPSLVKKRVWQAGKERDKPPPPLTFSSSINGPKSTTFAHSSQAQACSTYREDQLVFVRGRRAPWAHDHARDQLRPLCRPVPAHLLITLPPPPPPILISIRANIRPLSPSPGHLFRIPASGLAKPDSLHQGVLLPLIPDAFALIHTTPLPSRALVLASDVSTGWPGTGLATGLLQCGLPLLVSQRLAITGPSESLTILSGLAGVALTDADSLSNNKPSDSLDAESHAADSSTTSLPSDPKGNKHHRFHIDTTAFEMCCVGDFDCSQTSMTSCKALDAICKRYQSDPKLYQELTGGEDKSSDIESTDLFIGKESNNNFDETDAPIDLVIGQVISASLKSLPNGYQMDEDSSIQCTGVAVDTEAEIDAESLPLAQYRSRQAQVASGWLGGLGMCEEH
ncbi:unnamed protein product [Mycena citricolor]|uniref:Alpha-type protein kinase domain-containing protein n=1 Tax=Mycena citricolor TaxID=2018698 RepID=A0AAD2K4V8_9AGAR|nr:unnamed protein product [Mycena citricolor]